MYSAARKAIDAYAEVGVETGVAAADPHKLILMLFDGTLAAIAKARLAMSRGEIAAKGAAISKAIEIIDGGLKASLDVGAGGALAERLAALYDYMLNRLLAANLRNDTSLLDETTRLLNELRGAWAQIGNAAATAGEAGK
ncbi:MAG: flagellar export chaperone FliS [Betaproteobacteria bacterium]|nr:flagellar export chaperone FliS [Betaproteobacteria bacterium]